MQNFDQIPSTGSRDIELKQNKILTITKGHNCVVYLQKLMDKNSTLDLVNSNAFAKFGLRNSINLFSR